jgi:putative tricarboxylic transport membrane protein
MRDWVLAGCAVIGALIYLYADSQLPLVRIGDPLGPKIFPAIIGGGLLLSGLLLMLETYRKRRQVLSVSAAAPSPAPPAPAHAPQDRQRPGVLLGMLAWTVVYYFAFEPVGYLVSTVVFLLGLLTMFHRKKPRTNLAVALGFTAVIYAIFTQLLHVPMPQGILEFL